jgi:hypothetical protein
MPIIIETNPPIIPRLNAEIEEKLVIETYEGRYVRKFLNPVEDDFKYYCQAYQGTKMFVVLTHEFEINTLDEYRKLFSQMVTDHCLNLILIKELFNMLLFNSSTFSINRVEPAYAGCANYLYTMGACDTKGAKATFFISQSKIKFNIHGPEWRLITQITSTQLFANKVINRYHETYLVAPDMKFGISRITSTPYDIEVELFYSYADMTYRSLFGFKIQDFEKCLGRYMEQYRKSLFGRKRVIYELIESKLYEGICKGIAQ